MTKLLFPIIFRIYYSMRTLSIPKIGHYHIGRGVTKFNSSITGCYFVSNNGAFLAFNSAKGSELHIVTLFVL